MDGFFDGFRLQHLPAGDVRLRVRIGGDGPPLLLLHGNPQTHAMWHRVAPALARRFTVIAPDLRGYGGSDKPPVTPDARHYTKRAMAADMRALMHTLGFSRFAVAAHDRGARVAHRLALDAPEAVERLAVMDIVPTLHHFETADSRFALGYWHWFFLAQPHPWPERMIRADIEGWFRFQSSREPKDDSFFHAQARADYLAALHTPGTIEAICEDYRAAAGLDLEHDGASRAGRPAHRLPAARAVGPRARSANGTSRCPSGRRYADGLVSGGSIASGHYLPEEAPEEVLAAVVPFLGGKPSAGT